MNKIKQAFTLAEIIIALLITGIIFSMSLSVVSAVQNSYTVMTYFAHKNVIELVGALIAGNIENSQLKYDNIILGSILTTSTVNGKTVNIFKSDNELFCKSIVALSNTAGETDCSTFYDVTVNDSSDPTMSVTFDSPNFRLSNGMRFYLSKWTGANANISSNYGFRLIAVDINGNKKPNSATNEKKPSDLVTFLVLDNGEVYPLGNAADNLKLSDTRTVQYINTKLKGYYFSNDTTRESKADICEKIGCNFGVVTVGDTLYSYREAFCKAYANRISYPKYCSNYSYTQYENCPPSNSSSQFDLCIAESVKPMFRFSF